MYMALSEGQSNRIRRFASRGLFRPIERTAIVKWAESDQDFLQSFNLLYERYLELDYIKERKSFPFHCNAHILLPKRKKPFLSAAMLSFLPWISLKTPKAVDYPWMKFTTTN